MYAKVPRPFLLRNTLETFSRLLPQKYFDPNVYAGLSGYIARDDNRQRIVGTVPQSPTLLFLVASRTDKMAEIKIGNILSRNAYRGPGF